MEHISHLPGASCGVAFNGMCQGIHTGRSGQSFWHGGHHLRIDNCHDGHVMRINADELALLFHIGDHVVDGHFGSGAGSGGNSDGGHARILGGGHAFEASHIFKLRIGNDDADGLGGIHGRTAADGDDVVSAGLFESSHTGLHIFNRGIGLDV